MRKRRSKKAQPKGLYERTHKLVATWVPLQDYELLQSLAAHNKVGVAAYLRAIITDALSEERAIFKAISKD